MKELSTLIPELRQIALDSGANDLRLIATDIIKTAAWVRLKCRYGCKAYGKHLSCPPYSPTPDETEKILSDYEDAVLVEFVGLPKETTVDPRHIHHHLKDLILQVEAVIFNLERHAFLSGCYKAFGFGAYPCSLCEYSRRFSIGYLSRKNFSSVSCSMRRSSLKSKSIFRAGPGS